MLKLLLGHASHGFQQQFFPILLILGYFVYKMGKSNWKKIWVELEKLGSKKKKNCKKYQEKGQQIGSFPVTETEKGTFPPK